MISHFLFLSPAPPILPEGSLSSEADLHPVLTSISKRRERRRRRKVLFTRQQGQVKVRGVASGGGVAFCSHSLHGPIRTLRF